MICLKTPWPKPERTRPHPRGTRRAPLHHTPGSQPLGDRSDRARHRHDQAHRSRARGARDATARHAGALLSKLRHDVHRARSAWARSERHRDRRLLPLVLRRRRLHLRNHHGGDDRGLRATHGGAHGLVSGRVRIASGRHPADAPQVEGECPAERVAATSRDACGASFHVGLPSESALHPDAAPLARFAIHP